MADYIYPPVALPSGSDRQHIRLLDILPGRFDAEVQLSLFSVRLDNSIKYEALSYTWGASTQARSVLVNSTHRLPITNNLYWALKRLRRKHANRTIWIDALCINQLDLQERADQVATMGEIYRSATCVDIWLGEPAPGISISIVSIIDALTVLTRRQYGVTRSLRKAMRIALPLVRGEHHRLESALENSAPPWHERAWVIQERILARCACILFGDRQWSEDRLDQVSIRLPDDRKVSRDNTSHLDLLAWRMVATTQFERTPGATDLIDVVALLQGCNATDERDLIYSMLGVINHHEARLIGVDYTLPMPKLCAKATYASIRSRNDLAILRGVCNIDDSSRDEFASWAFNMLHTDALDMLVWGGTHRDPDSPRPKALFSLPEVDDAYEKLTLRAVRCGQATDVRPLSVCGSVGELTDSIRNAVGSTLPGSTQGPSSRMLFERAAASYSPNWKRSTRIPVSSFVEMCESIGWLPHKVPARLQRSTTVDGQEEYRYSDNDDHIEKLFLHWHHLTGALPAPSTSRQALDHIHHAFIQEHGAKQLTHGSKNDPLDSTRFIALDSGLIGLARSMIECGDIVVAFPGSSHETSPFLILRAHGSSYKFRGLAYVHSCMSEDFWTDWGALDEMWEEFVIS